MLEQEREFARQTRDKLQGGSNSVSSQGYQGGNSNTGSMASSAAPASGQSQKYGGFGSEDISRLGYNN